MTTDYTRAGLLALCEAASVPESEWRNRDSASAQRQVGECMFLLRAGCEFKVISATDDTVRVDVFFEGFGFHDYLEGEPKDRDEFYLPTADRLRVCSGEDWY